MPDLAERYARLAVCAQVLDVVGNDLSDAAYDAMLSAHDVASAKWARYGSGWRLRESNGRWLDAGAPHFDGAACPK